MVDCRNVHSFWIASRGKHVTQKEKLANRRDTRTTQRLESTVGWQTASRTLGNTTGMIDPTLSILGKQDGVDNHPFGNGTTTPILNWEINTTQRARCNTYLNEFWTWSEAWISYMQVLLLYSVGGSQSCKHPLLQRVCLYVCPHVCARLTRRRSTRATMCMRVCCLSCMYKQRAAHLQHAEREGNVHWRLKINVTINVQLTLQQTFKTHGLLQLTLNIVQLTLQLTLKTYGLLQLTLNINEEY